MPPDERILKSIELQKITKFREKVPVNVEYENKKQDGNIDYRKNRYNTITRNGLDEKIQTNDRKNTTGREQLIRRRKSRTIFRTYSITKKR